VFDRSKRLDIVVLQNRKGWVFDDVTPQYTIGLVCIAHGMAEGNAIRLRGPFASLAEFRHGVEQPAACFDRRDVLDWNDTASLPLLPDSESIAVFAQLRKAPRLDLKIGGGRMAWRARPDREMDATLQKAFMSFELPDEDGAQGRTANSTRRSRSS